MKETRTAYMVYIGRSYEENKGYYFKEFEPDQNNGAPIEKTEILIHSKPIRKGLLPGMIIEVQKEDGPDGGSVYPSTAKHVGHWKNESDVAEWAARDTARRIDNARKTKAMLELTKRCQKPIEELSAKYRSITGRDQRHAFLAWVIGQVTK